MQQAIPGKRRSALTAFLLAMACCALNPGTAVAAETEEPAESATATETLTPKSKREPRSKSSQSLSKQNPDQSAEAKRNRVNLSKPDQAPAGTIESRGLRGKASFYAAKFNGRKTATGEIFNNKLFTAASNLLPLGSMVIVSRPDTNLCVVVKVNDRMHPKHQARVIDLSHSAAKYLDMVRDGVAKVHVVRIPDGTTPGATMNCAMGFELEESCENCEPPLQFLNN